MNVDLLISSFRGSGGNETHSCQLAMYLISFPPVDNNIRNLSIY